MDNTRFIQLMQMELSSDILKKEENLEKAINSDKEIDSKIMDVKFQLQSLAISEIILQKFTTMLVTDENNKNKN